MITVFYFSHFVSLRQLEHVLQETAYEEMKKSVVQMKEQRINEKLKEFRLAFPGSQGQAQSQSQEKKVEDIDLLDFDDGDKPL